MRAREREEDGEKIMIYLTISFILFIIEYKGIVADEDMSVFISRVDLYIHLKTLSMLEDRLSLVFVCLLMSLWETLCHDDADDPLQVRLLRRRSDR